MRQPASLNMSKLVVVTGQENIDDVTYSHAQSPQGIFPTLTTRYRQVLTCQNLLSRSKKILMTLAIRTPTRAPFKVTARNFATLTPAPTCKQPPPRQTEFQEFRHAYTCAQFW